MPAAIYLLIILPFGTQAASLALLFIQTHPFPVTPVAPLPPIEAFDPLVPFLGNPSIGFIASISVRRSQEPVDSPVGLLSAVALVVHTLLAARCFRRSERAPDICRQPCVSLADRCTKSNKVRRCCRTPRSYSILSARPPARPPAPAL